MRTVTIVFVGYYYAIIRMNDIDYYVTESPPEEEKKDETMPEEQTKAEGNYDIVITQSDLEGLPTSNSFVDQRRTN